MYIVAETINSSCGDFLQGELIVRTNLHNEALWGAVNQIASTYVREANCKSLAGLSRC